MKNFFILSLLTTALISLNSCKKDDSKKSNESSANFNRTEFILTASGNVVDIVDNGAAITLLIDEGNQPKIVKLDIAGNLLWEKSYSDIQAKPVELIEVENGNYVFSTTNGSGSEEWTAYTGWFQESIDCNPENLVMDDFMFRTDSVYARSKIGIRNTLNKVDSNGSAIWNQILEQRSSYVKINKWKDRILVAQNLSFYENSYMIDRRFGGQFPVITWDSYNGTISLEEYDSFSGKYIKSEKWSKDELNGFNAFNSQLDIAYSDPYYFEVLIGKNAFNISYTQGFLQFINDIPIHIDGPFKVCKNEENHRIQSAAIDAEGNIYYSGVYAGTNGEVTYLACSREDGSVAWQKPVSNFNSEPLVVTNSNQKGCYLITNNLDINYYDENGQQKASASESGTLGQNISRIVTGHPLGLTYILESGSNQLIVRQTLN